MRVQLCAFLVLLYSLAVIAAPDVAAKEYAERALEDKVDAVLECVRVILQQGVPEHNIPSFDPLIEEDVVIDLDSLGVPGLSGFALFDYLLVGGVTDFVQSDLVGKINLFPPGYNLKLKLTIPAFVAETKQYAVDVSYSPADIHVYGAGKFGVQLEDFWVQVDATISLIPAGLSNLSVKLGVKTVASLELTGLYEDDEFSAQLVQSILNDPNGFLAENAVKINSLVSGIVVGIVSNGGLENGGFLNYVKDHCL